MTANSAPISSADVAGALVGPQEFRDVVGRLASGVTVITTADGTTRFGMTASSVTSLSADPPMMIACLNNATPTSAAVGRAGAFAVNILAEGHGELAHRFSTPSANKFDGVSVDEGLLGIPLLRGALARMECEVTEQIVGGTHTVYLGRVVRAQALDGQPLTYFRGGFGRFSFTRDDETYHRARDRVLQRVYAVGDVIDVDELAQSLDVDGPAAFYALTKLAADDLVTRNAERGYVVNAFDATVSDATFDARLTIELGVIAAIADEVRENGLDRVELATLRRRFEQMATLLHGERFVDFDGYLEANYAFHEAIIDLAHNPLLTSTFGSLSIRTVMTRSFGATTVTSEKFVESQRQILAAFEERDPEAAARSARAYCELAKGRVREILAHTGGLL